MKHGEHGGVARFPADAREGWEGRGWTECPEPAPEEDNGPAPVTVEKNEQKSKVNNNG